jgi:creatinine amidohydrolase
MERLRPDQLEVIRSRAPVAYIPWGAIEWHSYHDPVGLDGIQALGQARALCEATGGVVLPPIYVGTDTIKTGLPFGETLEHAADTVEILASEFLQQLHDERWRVVVIVSGHCGGGHIEALGRAVDAFNARGLETHAGLIPSFDPIQAEYPSNHAARGETSFQLLFDPESVALERLPSDRVATLEDDGVWGDDPRNATAAEGAQMLALFVERAAPAIRDLLEKTHP